MGHPEGRKANGCLFPPSVVFLVPAECRWSLEKTGDGSIESESLRGPMEVEMDTVNLIHRGLD